MNFKINYKNKNNFYFYFLKLEKIDSKKYSKRYSKNNLIIICKNENDKTNRNNK